MAGDKLNPGEKLILKALEDGPLTPREISERTGIGYKTLYGAKTIYIGKLRGLGLIHVEEYRRQSLHGGPPVPVFAAGKGKDAERPPRKTNAERSANWQRARKIRRMDKSIVAILLGTKKAPTTKPKAKRSDLSTFLGITK